MLQEQELRRFAPETLQRMHARTLAGGDWLDVVSDIQREIAIGHGFSSTLGIGAAVQEMRIAHVSHPQLAHCSVYARANLAVEGTLQCGDQLPNLPLWSLDGVVKNSKDYCAPLTVICAGSWT
jgi:hypothetical protein